MGGGDYVMAKLTPKQKDFADYYIETGNATDSYRRAYDCTEKTASVEGFKNLAKPSVKQYLESRIAEKDSKKIAKQDEILEFLTSVLRGEEKEKIPIVSKDFFELVDNTPSIKDRTKAAELLGKRYTLWVDKHSIDGNLGVKIVDDIK